MAVPMRTYTSIRARRGKLVHLTLLYPARTACGRDCSGWIAPTASFKDASHPCPRCERATRRRRA